ncbi:hypothetical protein [Arthrobacter sp. ES3-54]|uniref:hypothetical protein n=1 Tax=Arthrobacter sp. ES3-54 TaxID=1502991 RepID=UPI00240751EA|nr:hypothetical protein [Arthrobacter sp. ES3-54]MDF9753000.1 hypothetical protein [Arthrobacter sp. ES3-54]
MDPAAASSRAGRTLRRVPPMRPLRRVLFAAVAGAAWLTFSGTAAQADDTCTLAGTADDAGDRAAAAECRNADDLPVPSLDGLSSVDIAPAPAGTWSAGAVPGPRPDVSDVTPADAHEPAQADPGSAAPVPGSLPPAPGPAAPDPVPAAVDPTLPVPAVTPPVVDPGVPGVDPVVVPPVVDPPVVVPPVVAPPVVVPPVVDPAAPDPGVVPPVIDPALPVPDPAGPRPGGPAAVPPGGVVPGEVVPGGVPVGTPAAVDGASTTDGTPASGTGKAGNAKAGTAKATAPQQPPPASSGPDAARPLEAYQPQIAPVAYASWLMPEPRAAAPVRLGAAPPAEPPAGTGTQPVPSGNPGPSPWHGGTSLPVPEALPPAPGSGSGSGNSPNGPAGTAAWMPSLFFYLPTIGADPIGGPLQHEYAAVCADPGSSPD